MTGLAQGAARITAIAALWAGALALPASSVGLGLGQVENYAAPTGIAPNWITSGPDDAMWFTSFNGSAISRIDAQGTIRTFSTSTAPNQLAAGADGALWFTEVSGGNIGRITVDGAVTEYPVPGGPATEAIALGPDDNIWFSASGTLGRITPSGTVTLFPIPTPETPGQLTVGMDGALWYTLIEANRVGRMTLDGSVIEHQLPTTNPGADGERPNGLVVVPDGSIWFASDHSAQLQHLLRNGNVTGVDAVSSGDTWMPSVRLGPDGAIWWTRQNAGGLGRRTPDGSIVEAHVPAGAPGHTWSVAVGSDGNMWATNTDDGQIIRVGTGSPRAMRTAPTITGSARAADRLQCAGERWSTWTGEQPADVSVQWSLDGVPIAGATERTYTPVSADVGHALTCTVQVRYDLLAAWAVATSASVTIGGAATGPAGAQGTPGTDGAAGSVGPQGPAGGSTGIRASGAEDREEPPARHLARCADPKRAMVCTKEALVGPAATRDLGTLTTARTPLVNLRNGKRYAVNVRRLPGGALTLSRQTNQPIPRGWYRLRLSDTWRRVHVQ